MTIYRYIHLGGYIFILPKIPNLNGVSSFDEKLNVFNLHNLSYSFKFKITIKNQKFSNLKTRPYKETTNPQSDIFLFLPELPFLRVLLALVTNELVLFVPNDDFPKV